MWGTSRAQPSRSSWLLPVSRFIRMPTCPGSRRVTGRVETAMATRPVTVSPVAMRRPRWVKMSQRTWLTPAPMMARTPKTLCLMTALSFSVTFCQFMVVVPSPARRAMHERYPPRGRSVPDVGARSA